MTLDINESLFSHDIWLNLGVWGLLGYTFYKDVKTGVQTYFKNKNDIATKIATTQQKDAESLRQQRIDRTLVNIEDFLKIIIAQNQKQVTEDQARIILKGALTVARLDITVYVATLLAAEDDTALTINHISRQIETSYTNMTYDLSKFTFKDMPLPTFITRNFIEDVGSLIYERIFTQYFNAEVRRSHSALQKLLQEYFNSLYSETVSKFIG